MDVKEHVILGLKPEIPEEELVAAATAWRLQGFVSTSVATAKLLEDAGAEWASPAAAPAAGVAPGVRRTPQPG